MFMSNVSGIEWEWLRLEDMSTGVLYRLMALRESIFVVEQNCAYQEMDGRDDQAWHLLGSRADFPVACLRVLVPGRNSGCYRIGRVAVEESWRGKGLARQMLLMALDKVAGEVGKKAVTLDAQSYLAPFYQSLGFDIKGDEFLEDGIPHIPMEYDWERHT
jgi:ElaA protein